MKRIKPDILVLLLSAIGSQTPFLLHFFDSYLRNSERLPPELVSLCSEIPDAYAKLHTLGVIHSDVHANNLLVMENGEVRIIDHGLARSQGDDFELALVPRAGVGFFFEPEYAQAGLSGSMLPLSSCAGEQYSVAALIYFLLTGQYYLHFTYGKEEMLHQIAEHLPLPLSSRGIRGADALNEVLFRALRKEPSARFPDMAAMAAEFRSASSRLALLSKGPEHSRALARDPVRGAQDRCRTDWLDSTLNSLSDPTIDLPICGLRFPTASLTFGSAGIAYGLFRIACTREDAQLFALAERWIDRALREIGQDTGFYHQDVQITPETVGRISPYHSPCGIACVQALLAHSFGDVQTRSAAAERFLKLSSQACENPDITLGRSSTLLALSLLVDAFRWDTTVNTKSLIEAGNSLLTGLWEQFDKMRPIGDPTFPTYLGMAHGWAGYLYATLRWMRSAQVPAPNNVRTRLRELADQAQRRGSRVFWPCETRPNSPRLGGWCNGSAGFVHLWSLAHRLLLEPEWLLLAEGAGEDVRHAREEGPSLCCGLTGKAYSQLTLYKQTGNPGWLDNAISMARLAVRQTEMMAKTAGPRIPYSLYKGEVGLAVLVAELEHPESSAMPFFEDEAWPTSGSHR